MQPVDPLIGRVVNATWRLEQFVARGTMGTVYRGSNVKIGTPIAVKVLNPEFLNDPLIRERFRREAMVSSLTDSPYVVRVYDLCTEADGWVFLIMEWLSGMSLGEYLLHRGQLRPGEVVALLTQVAEGLGAAHQAGIVHRDIKPGNLYLVRTGASGVPLPKIVDFGLSKVLAAGGQLTAAATMLGTPHYMPVEQFNSSADADLRADIYALGVIGYEALAGRRPFHDGTPVQILNEINTRTPEPLPATVPAALAQVVLRAMSRQRDDRWASTMAFATALQGAAAATGIVPQPLDSMPGLAAPAPSPPAPLRAPAPAPVSAPAPAPQRAGPPHAGSPPMAQAVPRPHPMRGPPYMPPAYPNPMAGRTVPHRRGRNKPTPVWLVILTTLGILAAVLWLVSNLGWLI